MQTNATKEASGSTPSKTPQAKHYRITLTRHGQEFIWTGHSTSQWAAEEQARWSFYKYVQDDEGVGSSFGAFDELVKLSQLVEGWTA